MFDEPESSLHPYAPAIFAEAVKLATRDQQLAGRRSSESRKKLDNGAKAVNVIFTADDLVVELEDGRTISVPLMYYPRLYHGSIPERENWTIEGEGIHWADLDEDIRTADLLIGNHSLHG